MARVWLVQLLCPERHCIMGMAYEEGDPVLTKEKCEEGIWTLMKHAGLRQRCGICGSKQLVTEAAPTRFMSMSEAAPHLKAMEAANLLSRAELDAMGLTVDIKEFNTRN